MKLANYEDANTAVELQFKLEFNTPNSSSS